MAQRLLLLTLSTVLSLGCAEVIFRSYAHWKFGREFPPWTENLVVVHGAQVVRFKPNASGVVPGNVHGKPTHGSRPVQPGTAR